MIKLPILLRSLHASTRRKICNLSSAAVMHFKYSFFFTRAKGSLWKLQIRKRVQIFKRIDICFCLHPLDTRTSRGSTVTRWWYWIDGCAVQIFFKSMTWLMTPRCCFVDFFNASNIFNHVIIVNLQTHFLWHIMEFPFCQLTFYLLYLVIPILLA